MSATAVITATGPAAWPAPLSQTRTVAKLHSVTKRYGPITALNNFSLELGAGEVVALLGPNGAGKTTAVRLLLGLISPNKGSARVLGRDPRDAEARTRIGAMLQVARVPEMLRVREHIDLFRSYFPILCRRPRSSASQNSTVSRISCSASFPADRSSGCCSGSRCAGIPISFSSMSRRWAWTSSRGAGSGIRCGRSPRRARRSC